MKKEYGKIISSVLCICMLLTCLSGIGVSFAAEEAGTVQTVDGFYDVEVESLEYNEELVTLANDSIYSKKKALKPLKEDKNQPAKGAASAFSLKFTADKDGTYNVWLRHTSSITRQNGGNLWLAVNGGSYGVVGLAADPDMPMWSVIKQVTLKAGETVSIDILPRQVVNIGYDRFVVSCDPKYEPTDKSLRVNAAATAGLKPAPTPTPVPTPVPVTESGIYKIIDTTTDEGITSRNMTVVKDQKGNNKRAAQWNISSVRNFGFSGLNDISNYTNIYMRVKGTKNKTITFLLHLLSNNPDTEGDDYYSKTITLTGDEWTEIDIPFTAMGAARTPNGFDKLNSFAFRSQGWDIEIEPDSYVYFDEFYLYIDKDVKKAQEDAALEDEQTNLKYLNASAFGDFSKIENAVCLYINNPYGLNNAKRVAIDKDNKNVVPFINNSRTLVPVRFISEQLGAKVDYDDASKKITITKDSNKIEMTVGSNKILKNGAEITIDTPANVYNDRTFVPLRACAEALDKEVFWDPLGLIIISDTKDIYDSDADRFCIASIIGEMVFERPTGEQMAADLQAANPNNAHPRLLATKADIDSIKERAKTDATLQSWIDSVVRQYKGVLEQPTVTFPASTSAKGYLLETSRQAMNKFVGLAASYQLTGDDRYAQRALKEIKAVSEFPSWDPDHFLDTGEMTFGVCLAYDWCYDSYTAEEREFIEDTIYRLGFYPGYEAYKGGAGISSGNNRSGWKNATTNWNAVCNTGCMYAAITLLNNEKYSEEAKCVMGESIKSIEKGVRDYAPDGGYAEGPGYWEYGTTYLFWYLAGIDSAFGTDYGVSKFPGVCGTGYYATYIDGPVGTFNYSDSGSGHLDLSTSFWFAKKAGDANLASLRYRNIANAAYNASIKDILFYDPSLIRDQVQLDNDIVFKGIGTAIFRTNWTDSSAVYAGIHGGKNNSNHGNLDAGTFMMDANGVRWFEDLGGDSYNLPDYFGAVGLKNYYRKRAEGQNTITVQPGSHSGDQNLKAITDVVKFESKPKGGYAVLDMKDALGVSKVDSGYRAMMLTNNRRSVVLQDEIVRKESGEAYWFAHTKADIEIAADGKSAVLTRNGERLYAQIVSSNDAKFTVMDAVRLPDSPPKNDLETDNAGIRKLAIHLTNVKDINLAVVFTVLNDGETKPMYNYTYTKIADWSIEDGAIEMPTLASISLNSVPYDVFNPYTTEYDIVLPFGTEQVPEIEAAANGDYKVEIKKQQQLGEITTIRVYKESDPSVSSTYVLRIRTESEVEIEASHNQEGNVPSNIYDGDIMTRWSAQGEAWIKFTFIQPKEIEAVSLATMSSASRSSIIDIEYSLDGENWVQFFSGQTALVAADTFEDFRLPQKMAVKAIRIKGHGNTSNTWNSYTEVKFK